MAQVQRQGSPTISVILPKDSQWSCQRASDQRAFNHIVYNVPFLGASLEESLFERRRKKSATRPGRGREEDKAFRNKYNPKASEMRECYNFILLLQVTFWSRLIPISIYINICIYSVFRNDIDILSQHIRQIILNKKIHILSIRYRDIDSLINQNYTFIFILYNLPVIFL